MRRKKLLRIILNGTQALEKRQTALHEALEKMAPLIAQAGEYFGPGAEAAAERIKPILKQGARIAHDHVQPALGDIAEKVVPVVNASVKKVQPGVEELLTKIPPVVAAAKTAITDELLPILTSPLDRLGQPEPVIEVVIAEPAKKKSWKKRFWLFVLFAGLAGIAVAVKKALEPPAETGWISYTPPDSFVAHPGAEATEDFVPTAEVLHDPADVDVVAEPEAEELELTAENPYGEGSFVGEEPPAGFDIKGNVRSKKYHQAGQARYASLVPDVWFNSVEAAQAAGFQASKT